MIILLFTKEASKVENADKNTVEAQGGEQPKNAATSQQNPMQMVQTATPPTKMEYAQDQSKNKTNVDNSKNEK